MPYTAQFILQGNTNLPEDRFVNTFAFVEDQGVPVDPETAATGITAALQNFYTVGVGTDPALQTYYAAFTGTEAEVRVYDMADPQPREPIINTFPWAPTASAGSLPGEVALCLSYYANRNLPTTRGRIYLGPLNNTAAPATTDPARPVASLITAMANRGTDLATSGAAAGALRWAVLSRAIAGVLTYSNITDGWVDNAFDTQRRRGVAASARTTWTVGA